MKTLTRYLLIILLLNVCHSPLTAQYDGGSGDGHDAAPLAVSLNAYDATLLFSGGAGDGHDIQALATMLSAYDANLLFSGGNGDGHDMQALATMLSAYDASLLFSGGNGDGHDMQALATMLSAYDATLVFGGGNGDGHDMQSLATMLSAYDATLVFSGGNGDGHDVGTFNGALLPLTLISFEAVPHEKFVLLKWVTTEERDTDFFVVERTRDGQSFDPLSKTVLASGFSGPNEVLHYETRDEAPYSGTSFYRLRSVDFDGSFQLSQLRQVNYATPTKWDYTVFPNPNDGTSLNLDIKGELPNQQPLQYEVVDAAGRVLAQSVLNGGAGIHQLDLNEKFLPAGQYFIRVGNRLAGDRVKAIIVVPR
ncbi:T9SS type A sorting domain-containing protein [Neolewinella antarctica]|uniref:Phosphoribosylformimino-5-aminoimidazole carboxamide ribonucleotide (ProFAR) isomerase n=1 Tax=Neolewinella antarctica TaxID=442734 RepID=A0ABX0X8U0_9BACT|nr:T9SS type A sorting domain-containing protein [Neolewinella antarctica]NJC25680.1 phosphoribosylformimino-5-aminoimidazole carboxamide ribonucleotide (ProFAR) isomerase [Neolewinella antarctica]